MQCPSRGMWNMTLKVIRNTDKRPWAPAAGSKRVKLELLLLVVEDEMKYCLYSGTTFYTIMKINPNLKMMILPQSNRHFYSLERSSFWKTWFSTFQAGYVSQPYKICVLRLVIPRVFQDRFYCIHTMSYSVWYIYICQFWANQEVSILNLSNMLIPTLLYTFLQQSEKTGAIQAKYLRGSWPRKP